MNISVSSLGFCGHPIYNMKKLPPELGIEIFYEWGSEAYWECALTEIMRGPLSGVRHGDVADGPGGQAF